MLIPKYKKYVVNTTNRIISDGLQMSLNTRETDRNNNILVIGGSGAGKTFRFVKPQLLQLSTSFVCTDPKGELMRDTNAFMEKNGYNVKCLNLLNSDGMKKSTHYNPFNYIKTDTDVIKLVTTFMDNTIDKDASLGDPFWTDMAGLRLQAFMFYVRDFGVVIPGEEEKGPQKNFKAVMNLVNRDGVETNQRTGARVNSELDDFFEEVEREHPDHPSVIAYNNSNEGAADTVRSIISTLRSRTTRLNTPEILELLSDDEIDIKSFGEKKTVLYCVIPDNDRTYNFLIGILYVQMFQQLYYSADFIHGGRLPIHVSFLLDEFCNIALPDDFLSLLSTMRSREISSVIIIQDLSQIKKMYKDGEHESIMANCDTWVYLGGNGPSTQKELSEMMGKRTIDKKTNGETKGKQGSASHNYDVIGRELMFPDELRKLNGRYCVVFIRGYDVIFDNKINSLNHPLWDYMIKCGQRNFDARLYRLKKNNNKYEIDYAKFKQLQYEDEYNYNEYKNEKKVAEMTNNELPQMPDKRIYEVTLNELLDMYNMVSDIPESEKWEFSEEELARNRQKAKEEAQLELNKIIKEHEEQEEKKELFENPDIIILFGKLKTKGFNEKQIEMIISLFKNINISINEIFETFDASMDDDLVFAICNAMNS